MRDKTNINGEGRNARSNSQTYLVRRTHGQRFTGDMILCHFRSTLNKSRVGVDIDDRHIPRTSRAWRKQTALTRLNWGMICRREEKRCWRICSSTNVGQFFHLQVCMDAVPFHHSKTECGQRLQHGSEKLYQSSSTETKLSHSHPWYLLLK